MCWRSNWSKLPNIWWKIYRRWLYVQLIEVFWPLDNIYYKGEVSDVDDGWKHTIQYDDGDQEKLDLSTETWKISTVTANSIAHPALLQRNTKQVLAEMFRHLGNKSFMKFHAQGHEQYPLINDYRQEDEHSWGLWSAFTCVQYRMMLISFKICYIQD